MKSYPQFLNSSALRLSAMVRNVWELKLAASLLSLMIRSLGQLPSQNLMEEFTMAAKCKFVVSKSLYIWANCI